MILNDLFGTLHDILMGVLRAVLPDWLAQILVLLVGIGVTVTFVALVVMTQVWAERKAIARMQDRVGPNRVGPFGLLQPVADVLKLFSKEQVMPSGADRLVYLLAPLVVLVPSLMIYAVLPFNWDATITNLDVGVLYVLALATFPTIGILMAGLGSANSSRGRSTSPRHRTSAASRLPAMRALRTAAKRRVSTCAAARMPPSAPCASAP